jgi:hypothetical protein
LYILDVQEVRHVHRNKLLLLDDVVLSSYVILLTVMQFIISNQFSKWKFRSTGLLLKSETRIYQKNLKILMDIVCVGK